MKEQQDYKKLFQSFKNKIKELNFYKYLVVTAFKGYEYDPKQNKLVYKGGYNERQEQTNTKEEDKQ